jgi:hypothetical protein
MTIEGGLRSHARRKISAQIDGGGQAEGLACADPGMRISIGTSGICILFQLKSQYRHSPTQPKLNFKVAAISNCPFQWTFMHSIICILFHALYSIHRLMLAFYA